MGLFSAIGGILGGLTGASAQADAASAAGDLQYKASMAGIEEQKRQADRIAELMAPFVSTGTQALGQQGVLAGLDGNAAQQEAISGIESSPLFQSMQQQGENSILQNASATGGLRGGNVQGALAQFSPELLNMLVEQQYSRLGGLSNMGQASAAGQAASGLQTSANISNLLGEGAAARAGGVLAQGGVQANAMNNIAGLAGSFFGAGGFPGIKTSLGF